MPDGTVFLFDVDNTLLDNDAVAADLRAHLTRASSATSGSSATGTSSRRCARSSGTRTTSARCSGSASRIRTRRACSRCRSGCSSIRSPSALYPKALEVVERTRAHGRPVILSDGDVVFQPRKIRRSGLWDAFRGDVLVYIHKELELEDVERRYPADHYALVDDKVRILAAVKEAWGDRVTTIFPRQGHYAHDAEQLARYPAPDVTVERIGDVLALER